MKRSLLLILIIVVFAVLIYWLRDSSPEFATRQGEGRSSSSTGSGSMSESSSVLSQVAMNGEPFVVRHEPENGTRDVPLNGKVIIVFSVPMDRTTVQSALEADFPYFLRWTDDTELQLYPVGLVASERYRYSLGTDAEDKKGRAIAHKLIVQFSTTAKRAASSSSVASVSSVQSTPASFRASMPSSVATSSVAAPRAPQPIAPAVSEPPVIAGISVIVLRQDEEEIRARATVYASDPEGQTLTMRWSVNCGSLVGGNSRTEVEWRAPVDSCPQAVFTVEVRDPVGATTVYAEPAF